MSSCCPAEVHDAWRASVHDFFERTIPLPWAPDPVDGRQYRNCTDCRSTLTMEQCPRCFELCPTGDAVETRKGTFHVRCLLLRAVERGRFTVVAHVKVGKAAEFARVMP